MNDLTGLPGAPFDLVLDVGGNLGQFAELAVSAWPAAHVVSFEPIPELFDANVARSQGRWVTLPYALSDSAGYQTLYVCVNQHTASTMQEPGGTRAREFGADDLFNPIDVLTLPLDTLLALFDGRDRVLVKVDVEGHEGHVLAGARDVLTLATTVIVECQQDADIFIDAPSPALVNELLQRQGLAFAGIAGVLESSGRVLQFDGVWSREPVQAGSASVAPAGASTGAKTGD